MKPISDLFGNLARPPLKKAPRGERAELVQFFADSINSSRISDDFKPYPDSYFRFLLSYINIRDLYFLKSVCLDAQRTGGRFDTKFFTSVKTRTKPGKRKFPKVPQHSGKL